MHVAGRASWSFSTGLGGAVSRALFIRDAARLPVPSAPDVPPPCSPTVPDHTDLVADVNLEAAAVQWLDWWRDVVATHGRRQLEQDHLDLGAGDIDGGSHDLSAPPGELDPPGFVSLDGQPALQAVVARLFALPDLWPERPQGHGPDELLGGELVPRVVHEVARERGVPVNSLGACVLIVPVTSVWWAVARPGVVLASLGAVADREAAEQLTRAVYLSAA